MARTASKIIARKMRRAGNSMKGIAEKMKISKSTISTWCKDIELSQKLIDKIYISGVKKSLRGRLMGAEANKQKKINEVNKMFKEAEILINKISDRDLLIAGACLYWAEGAKTRGRFIFVNSDPIMIKIVYIFLIKILKINKKLIHSTVQINLIHKKRIKKVMKFWSEYLNIPLKNFSNPYYVNVVPKKIYENYDNYYGILRLQVLKGSSLQYKMLGFIEIFRKYAGVV
ncbi:MAG: hypothetical protein A2431_01445 [Candidatus Zambryskibacteria bacterium RIFOXYC1_FULL_39_10]|uniref:Uncharacterized protein n=1 Tax=Candidatus Zambryskibacteria bacterium RIFOXYC1_FULL_39_10 TaxID=1802779 RepID=A0A1G2V3Z2_9BACT|nr:MAG: hypothetical protein A2605_03285 [Candidatus Zambryskibacteria bacterium RIFOXYD1_FULL_39_35]OHB16344.1 MAG: hypothetical protein A2431_01445 [Candidatus Zambryskibacteria bacterium RIFOXYC1_FULL_39_10]